MKSRLSLLVLVMLVAMVLPAGAQGVMPWFIGLDDGVYRSDDGGSYRRVGLGSALDLAVNGGTPYVIGQDRQIWSCPGGRGDWVPILEGVLGQRLAADVDGSLFIIGIDRGVYRAKEGRVARLGLAVATDVCADGGTVYVIGTDARVWLTQDGATWKPYNDLALGTRVSAVNGQVFIIGLDGGVYSVTSERLERLGLATAVDLAVSPDGVPYIVGIDDNVWRYTDRNWSRYGSGQAKGLTFPR